MNETTDINKKPVSGRVGNDRLRRLADFLMTLPKQNFYYGEWSINLKKFWENKTLFRRLLAKTLKPFDHEDYSTYGNSDTCGTTGCAMGWAATMPYFNRLGLTLDHSGQPTTKRNKSALTAAAEIFGLSEGEAKFLFIPGQPGPANTESPPSDAAPRTVAKHILKFVERREKLQEQGAYIREPKKDDRDSPGSN